MKTIAIFLFAALAAFAQDQAPAPSRYVAGGIGGPGMFAVMGFRLNDSTSTYTDLNLAGTASVSQGIVRNVFHVDSPNFDLRVGVLGEAGAAVTGSTGFAGALGGVLSLDVSKWTKVPGLSLIVPVKFAKSGDQTYPVYAIGFSKSL